MKASELIILLKKAIKQYGDRDVVTCCQFGDVGQPQSVRDNMFFGEFEVKLYKDKKLIVIDTFEL